MKFKIHRGTKEVGGSCVEVWTDSTRIVLDLGAPLVNEDGTSFDNRSIAKLTRRDLLDRGILPNIQGLYEKEGDVSLLISHAHQDHFGLIGYMRKDCPVYLGEGTHELIKINNIVLNKNWEIKNPNYFESGKAFSIGNIEVTPYLMDHSAFDSYAFLLKSNGKSLFYSGDFRIHGRNCEVFRSFEQHIETNVDYLLLEGTSLGRSSEDFPSETYVQKQLEDSFKSSKGVNLIYASGQNIDRLVSIYKACKNTERIFVIDFYVAYVLKKLAGISSELPYPSKKHPELRVIFPDKLSEMMCNRGYEKMLYQFKHYKITKKEIDQLHERVVLLVRPSMLKDLERLEKIGGGNFIYSMWVGYKKQESTQRFLEFLSSRGITQTDIHTSGHADIKALRRMIAAVKPKKVVPIHTFSADEYQAVFPDEEIFRLMDNEVISI